MLYKPDNGYGFTHYMYMYYTHHMYTSKDYSYSPQYSSKADFHCHRLGRASYQSQVSSPGALKQAATGVRYMQYNVNFTLNEYQR